MYYYFSMAQRRNQFSKRHEKKRQLRRSQAGLSVQELIGKR
jgi:hypothetical protein